MHERIQGFVDRCSHNVSSEIETAEGRIITGLGS
jgi:hypothetical protein